MYISRWPACCQNTETFALIDHAATGCLKYHKQKKQKEIYNETKDHGRVTET